MFAFGDSSGIGRLLFGTVFQTVIVHSSLFTKNHVVWLFCCLVVLLIARSPQLRQRDFSLFTLHFSLFTKNHVVWLSCCLVVLLIERNPNRVSAIFHFSLFTFHFSLKEFSVGIDSSLCGFFLRLSSCVGFIMPFAM